MGLKWMPTTIDLAATGATVGRLRSLSRSKRSGLCTLGLLDP